MLFHLAVQKMALYIFIYSCVYGNCISLNAMHYIFNSHFVYCIASEPSVHESFL